MKNIQGSRYQKHGRYQFGSQIDQIAYINNTNLIEEIDDEENEALPPEDLNLGYGSFYYEKSRKHHAKSKSRGQSKQRDLQKYKKQSNLSKPL